MGKRKVKSWSEWSVQDYTRLMACSSACLCLLLVVLGTMITVVRGNLDPAILGRIEGVGVAGGILGMLWILYLLISRTFDMSGENLPAQHSEERQ